MYECTRKAALYIQVFVSSIDKQQTLVFLSTMFVFHPNTLKGLRQCHSSTIGFEPSKKDLHPTGYSVYNYYLAHLIYVTVTYS